MSNVNAQPRAVDQSRSRVLRVLRVTPRMLLFLFLGAIVNVLQAWSCAVWPKPEEANPLSFSALGDEHYGWLEFWSGDHGLSNTVTRKPGAVHLSQTIALPGIKIGHMLSDAEFEERAPHWSALKDRGTPLLDMNQSFGAFEDFGLSFVEQGAGWPLLSLRGSGLRSWSPSLEVSLPHADGLLLAPKPLRFSLSGSGRPRESDPFLPLYPVWPGFLLNTLVFAPITFLLWLAASSPWRIRRQLRRRRGLCVKCGYDLRGASNGALCPECGFVFTVGARVPQVELDS